MIIKSQAFKNHNLASSNFWGYFSQKITVFRWQLNLLAVISILIGGILGTFITLNKLYPLVYASGELNKLWDLSVSNEYIVSDASLIEVTNNSARLKVRNYETDGNTQALYHLDENSGSIINDSSGNSNTASASNTNWITGNLNYGLSLNGNSSAVTASDSVSLSLSQQNTLEAWTKFGSAFSANSHTSKQTILDKGNYQLYYDNVSGKIVYELARSGATNWAQVAGSDLLNGSLSSGLNNSWDQNGKMIIRASALIGTDYYIALGNTVSDAEVWKWNGSTWSQVGGDGLNSSWPDSTYEEVYALTTDGTNIFAGLGNTAGDGEVWKYNGTSWSKIGGDASGTPPQSWITNTYETVLDMIVDSGNLYVALGLSGGDSEVWSCSIASCTTTTGWSKLGGDGNNTPPQSWNSTIEGVYSLAISGTTLIVGLGNTAGDAEVWSCTIGSCTPTSGWSKRGGDGTGTGGQSWVSASGPEMVYKMVTYGTNLYVALGSTGSDGQVWTCDLAIACTSTTGWTKIGEGGSGTPPQSWATGAPGPYEYVTSLAMSGSKLYVGLGASSADAELWMCDVAVACTTTTGWSKLGGDGTGVSPQSWGTPFTFVASMSFIGNTIYVGVSDSSNNNSARVYTCDVTGTCSATLGWTRIAGDYFNNSWGYNGLQTIESMTTHNNKLYIGTGLTVARNAMVWEYDGTSWTRIAGQGINNSWTFDTYESVSSLMSFNGELYAGLGTTAGDGEVWKWNGSSWTKVGGDASGTGGQSWTNVYEYVYTMAVFNNELYVGLGASAGDAELWKCSVGCTTTTGWTKIGGDGNNTPPQSWSNIYEMIYSLVVFNNELYVGLGNTAGDAEVWKCSSSCTPTTGWAKVGGDGTGIAPQSWGAGYETVESMVVYRGSLYVGLGNTVGDAEVWRCDTGCTVTTNWLLVGGDGTGWANSLYERVRSMSVYNGKLYAGLGNGDNEAEVWEYDGSTWTKIGGDSNNNGWTVNFDIIPTLGVYNGKLYAGTGSLAGQGSNTEALVWAYGNNAVLKSAQTSQDTSWHHIAATYNGSAMKIYIDGVENASTNVVLTLSDTTNPLYLGSSQGTTDRGGINGHFNGYLDEIRISNTARTSFVTTPFINTQQTIRPSSSVFTSQVLAWDSFSTTDTLNGGSINYRLSSDGGSTWKYWNGSTWVTSNNLNEANDKATINTNISSFLVTESGFLWQAILLGNGNQQVTLNSAELYATNDITAPSLPNSLTSLDQVGGSNPIVTNTWYNYPTPSFTWTGSDDTGGSGVSGYYVYFGPNDTADPLTFGNFQVSNTFTASNLTTNQDYYLRIKVKDYAQNVSATVYSPFKYRYDATVPNNPSSLTVLPPGYTPNNSFTFIWTLDATDIAGSGVAGYQYSINNTSNWSVTLPSNTSQLELNGVANEGSNVFYLRTIDNTGNPSVAYKQVNFYYAGSAPTQPQNLTVNPAVPSLVNSFAFSWLAPQTHAGNSSEITYCYTVNSLPSENNCTFTSPGATALAAGAFANQPGPNTFYVVAKDFVGNINYNAYSSIVFTANTSAPGIPLNVEIADVSVKTTQSWKLAVSWEAPSSGANGITYEVYHSDDNINYSFTAEVSGIAHIDTNLTQSTHYYKIRACDNTSNCGAFSSIVSMYPDGRFTQPAELLSDPAISNITTKQAVISWITDRGTDSKIAYGKASGDYFENEPSNSDTKTSHSIKLVELEPETRYYFVAKWTDEDGNTGVSDEKSFVTAPSPKVIDPKVLSVNLTNATIKYTTIGAVKVRVYYGETSSFGSFQELPTSTEESTYTAVIDKLRDGTKYFFKVNTFDQDNSEYEGSTLTFQTLPRPKLTNIKVQQVIGTAQPTILVTWDSNTETSSIVSYYPSGSTKDEREEVNVGFVKIHRIIVRGLLPETPYRLVVKGRDKNGNEAESEPQTITTATDTRAPQISAIEVEAIDVPNQSGGTGVATSQLIISWNTDELSTSQIEYDEGTGSNYSQRLAEDKTLTFNHSVVISNLKPSTVYHFRVISTDKANNVAKSADNVTITPKASDNALDLVINNLSQVFSFLR